MTSRVAMHTLPVPEALNLLEIVALHRPVWPDNALLKPAWQCLPKQTTYVIQHGVIHITVWTID